MTSDQPPKEFNQNEKERLLYPLHTYYGDFTPDNLVFNANLQEFAYKVSYICSLETGAKTQGGYSLQTNKAALERVGIKP